MGLDSKRCIDSVHNDLTCAICLDILSLDCLIDDNDHVYCKKCIISWFDNGNSKCPIGNETIFLRLMKVPRIIKNLLSDLNVHCKFENKGCNDVVKYENLEKHEQNCSFNCYECPKGCEIIIKQCEINSHDCIKDLKLKIQELKVENYELIEKIKNLSTNNCPNCNNNTGKNGTTPPSIIIKQKSNFKLKNPFSKLWSPQNGNGIFMSRSCDDISQIFVFNAVKSSNTYKIASHQLVSMTTFPNQKQIIAVDASEDAIKLIDSKGKYLNTNNFSSFLRLPISICTNSAKTEIFIGSYENEEIFIFDSCFKLKKKICKNQIKKPCCLAIDNEILYIGDWDENKITIWSLKKDEKINNFDVDAPVAIRASIDKLYILSRTIAKCNETTKKFEKLESGSNCVFIYDKMKYNLIGKLILNNWLSPAGLHVDMKNNYIYTIAYELDKNLIRSNSRYLFVLNNKSDLIRKINLNDVQSISDMIVIDNRLIFCFNETFKIIELE